MGERPLSPIGLLHLAIPAVTLDLPRVRQRAVCQNTRSVPTTSLLPSHEDLQPLQTLHANKPGILTI